MHNVNFKSPKDIICREKRKKSKPKNYVTLHRDIKNNYENNIH